MSGPYIALYRGKSLMSRLIKWRTWGDYSHASWICRDGTEIEAWSNGIRRVEAFGADHTKGTEVHLFRVVGMTPEIADRVERMLAEVIGTPYDYRALFGFLLRTSWGRGDKWLFCSEVVFEFVRRAGIDLLERVKAHKVDPTLLSYSPLLLYVGAVVVGEDHLATKTEGRVE